MGFYCGLSDDLVFSRIDQSALDDCTRCDTHAVQNQGAVSRARDRDGRQKCVRLLRRDPNRRRRLRLDWGALRRREPHPTIGNVFGVRQAPEFLGPKSSRRDFAFSCKITPISPSPAGPQTQQRAVASHKRNNVIKSSHRGNSRHRWEVYLVCSSNWRFVRAYIITPTSRSYCWHRSFWLQRHG